jgi:hypothetical protein
LNGSKRALDRNAILRQRRHDRCKFADRMDALAFDCVATNLTVQPMIAAPPKPTLRWHAR